MNQITTRNDSQPIVEVKKGFPDTLTFWLEAIHAYRKDTFLCQPVGPPSQAKNGTAQISLS